MTRDDPLEALERARRQVSLGNGVLAIELLGDAFVNGDAEVRHHVRGLLPHLLASLDPRSDVAAILTRFNLSVPSRETSRLATKTSDRVGAAWAILVDQDRSGEAFLALVSLDLPSVHTPPLLDSPTCGAAFASAVDRAEQAVVSFLFEQQRFRPQLAARRPRVQIAIGRTDGATVDLPGWAGLVDGASIAAAAAVALYSSLSGLPVPDDLAFTGDVALDGCIRPVNHLEAKIRAALRERPSLRLVFVPEASEASKMSTTLDDCVRPVGSVSELLRSVFVREEPTSFAEATLDLEETCRLGEELFERRADAPAALAVMRGLLAALAERDLAASPRLRQFQFRALWRAGAAITQLGGVDEAQVLFAKAEGIGRDLFEAGTLDPRLYLGFRGSLAVLLRDGARFTEAEALLRETIALQGELRQDARERARTLGNLGELLSIVGRPDEAKPLLRRSLDLLREVYPDEVPRELCYLGDALLREGDAASAVEVYREGLEANTSVEHGREANEGFLRHGLARALLGSGRAREAIEEADRALAPLPESRPYPRQLVLKTRGLARLSLGEFEEGRRDLRAAADLRYARGELVRFGLSTALSALAIHLLEDGGPSDRAEAAKAAELFLEAARATPAWVRPDLLEELSGLLGRNSLDPEALASALARAAHAFPHG